MQMTVTDAPRLDVVESYGVKWRSVELMDWLEWLQLL